MNSRQAAEIAVGVAGVWLVVGRLPEVGMSLLFSARAPDPADSLAQLAISHSNGSVSFVDQFATPLAQLMVGLALFLGARGLVVIWQSLRVAGVRGPHSRA